MRRSGLSLMLQQWAASSCELCGVGKNEVLTHDVTLECDWLECDCPLVTNKSRGSQQEKGDYQHFEANCCLSCRKSWSSGKLMKDWLKLLVTMADKLLEKVVLKNPPLAYMITQEWRSKLMVLKPWKWVQMPQRGNHLEQRILPKGKLSFKMWNWGTSNKPTVAEPLLQHTASKEVLAILMKSGHKDSLMCKRLTTNVNKRLWVGWIRQSL